MPDNRSIVNAILGAAISFPTPDAFRAKLADLLLIHSNRHAFLSMWVAGRRVISSHPDHEIADFQARYPGLRGFDEVDQTDAIRPAGTRTFELVLRSMPSGESIAQDVGVPALFAEVAKDKTAGAFALDLLSCPVDQPTLPDEVETARTAQLEPDEVQHLLRPFRERFDAALESLSIGKNPLVGRWRGRSLPECRNLFVVVRYVPSLPYSRTVSDGRGRRHDYGYTARLLAPPGLDRLLATFSDQISFPKGRAELTPMELLEWPLGEGSRAIADTPFESGTVHLANLDERTPRGTQRDNPGADPLARARHSIESALYAHLFQGATQSFYVPVHVGGTSWLCLYSLNDEPHDSLRNYLLYREVVPRVSDQARAAAKEAFLDCLAAAFRQDIGPDVTDAQLDRVNAGWLRASMVYPFPVCSLQRENPVGGAASTPDRVAFGRYLFRVRVTHPISAFRPQVSYAILTPHDVAGRIQAESTAIRDRHASSVVAASREALRVHANIAHEMNSLFEKHFPSVGSSIAALPESEQQGQIAHAWNTIAATAHIAHLLGRSLTDPRFHPQLIKRFCLPLRELATQGQLEPALWWVARQVYARENRSTKTRVLELEMEPTAIRLTPEQYARCYVLCAEPIRNLRHHGTDTAAHWSSTVSADAGLTVTLHYEVDSDSFGTPHSVTFEAFGQVLKALDADGSYARVETGDRVRWLVHLSPGLLFPNSGKG